MPRLKFVSNVEGADTIDLHDAIITIGRGVENTVCIEDANISKYHVLLVKEGDSYRIFDLHSFNGTTVNGQKITVATLKHGDSLRFGYLELTYETAIPQTKQRHGLGKPSTATPPPTPAPQPAPAPAPHLGFHPKPLPHAEPAPQPLRSKPEATGGTPPPAPVENTPQAPKKFGAPPSNPNLKFRLKKN